MLLLTLPVAPMKLITRNFTAAVFKHMNTPRRWSVNQVSTPTILFALTPLLLKGNYLTPMFDISEPKVQDSQDQRSLA